MPRAVAQPTPEPSVDRIQIVADIPDIGEMGGDARRIVKARQREIRSMRKSVLAMMAVVTAIIPVAVAAPAQAQSERSVQQIIQTKTGVAGSLVTARQQVGKEGKIGIGTGRGRDGTVLETYAQRDAKASRVMAVLPDASQTSANFALTIPAGAKVEKHDDGTVVIAREFKVGIQDYLEVYATIEAPWAVDAAGTSLPTSYTVNGNVLTQNVDTAGATFPVVADPTTAVFGWYLGPVVYITFSRADTLWIHFNIWQAPVASTVMCAVFGGYAAIGCGIAFIYSIHAIDVQATYANSVYHRCLKIRTPYIIPPTTLPYVYTVYC